MRGLKFVKSFYVYLALLFFNVLLILVVVNLIFSALINLADSRSGKNRVPMGRFALDGNSPELRPVYPHMKTEDVETIFRENSSVPLGYQPFVQFAEKPVSGKFVNVDESGFRPIEDQSKWPPQSSDTSIFIFGGSTTFGSGVTDNETIASFLQKHLKAAGHEGVRIYNFGRGHYFSSQERILFQQLLLQNHIPSLAIFIDGLNDLNHYSGAPAYTKKLTKFMDDGETGPLWNLMLDLPMSRYFMKKPKESEASSVKDPKTIADHVIQRYIANQKLIDVIAKGYGIRTLFVWQPVPVFEYDQTYNIFGTFNYSRGLPYLKPGYEIMSREYESGAFGSNFLWLANVQRDLKEPLYIDGVHYSAKMSNLIASRIADRIISQGLLK